MPKLYKTGLVVGKFYPLHRGHNYLIDTALDQSDHVVVLVVNTKGQNISAQTRAAWIKKIHPTVEVRIIDDIYDDENSKAWAEYTIKILGQAPDAVFTSEDYGDPYARFMGCKHVLVDKLRITVPISGTKVRENPLGALKFLHPVVQSYFVKRVCVVGAESTGTTTLAKALAEKYNTVWVPEYGRMYSLGKMTGSSEWKSEEFVHIAQMQSVMEDELAQHANKVVICDTDSFATSIWHERYMHSVCGRVEEIAKKRKYDLYIVTNTDILFVQDGTRDGQHIRQWMHDRFVEKLTQWQLPFIVVSGSVQERVDASCSAIEQCFPEGSL